MKGSDKNQENKKAKAFYKNKKILITGASGYVAGNLLNVLKDVDCSIVRLSRNKLSLCQGCATIIDLIGDISKKETWEQALKGVDIVFQLASQTSVYSAQDNPQEDWKNNVLPMLNLLDVCHNSKLTPRIIFSGTVTQVGLTDDLPVDEEFVDSPITIYDIHKLMAEEYLRFYCGQGYVTGASLRFPNIFGPGSKSSSKDRGIINMMIRKALEGETLAIYGDGKFLRDYLFIDDLISALLSAGEKTDLINGEYFVLGTGSGYTVKESIERVATLAEKKTGKKVDVMHIAPPEGLSPIENRNFIGNSKKFTDLTGWRPLVSFDEGIIKTMESMLHKSE